MATRTIPKILGEAVEAASPWSRSSRHRHRTTPINRTNGGGCAVVARAQDSWRAENARHRHLRAYRLPHSAKAPPAAYPDLEDFPAHPCRANRIDVSSTGVERRKDRCNSTTRRTPPRL